MALVYKVSVNKNGTDCKQLLFIDQTGNYSTNNTGGWGGSNVSKSSIVESEVVITYPDNTDITIDLFNSPYQFPIVNSSAYYISGAAFEDGVYKFQFSVIGEEADKYAYTTYYLSTCNIDCCMSNFAGKINPSCACNDKMLQKWADMQSYYNAMLYNFECGNYNETTNLLNKLTAMCSKNGCGCGC